MGYRFGSGPVPVRWFVLITEAIEEVDLTAADVLEELLHRGIVFALVGVKQELRDTLRPSGLLDRISEDLMSPIFRTAVQSVVERVRGDPEEHDWHSRRT